MNYLQDFQKEARDAIAPSVTPSIGFDRSKDPIVDYAEFEEFKTAVLNDFVENSGIDRETAIAHIEFVPEFEYGAGGEIIATPIHDLLGIKYVRFGNRPNLPLFAAVFRNEDGSIFQMKLNQRWWDSSKGRHGKAYRFIKGSGAGLYLPAVTLNQWMAIAQKQNQEVNLPSWVPQAIADGKGDILSGSREALELAEESNEGGSFWSWAEWLIELKLVPTEGVKKSLSLLYRGYPALSLNGATAGYQTKDRPSPTLIPQLESLCFKGRNIVFAFDEDDNPLTRRKVANAQYKFGKLLSDRGCKVQIAIWESKEGKGVDDAIAAAGEMADKWLLATIDDAPSFEQWMKSERKARLMRLVLWLNSNEVTPELITTGRYIEALGDLWGGHIHGVQSSGTGDGKTTVIGKWVRGNKEKGFTLVLYHANSVGKQTSEPFGLPHIHDYDMSDSLQRELLITDAINRGGCIMCFDSLHRLPSEILELVNLLILDECNQGIAHLCEGGTLKDRQSEIMSIAADVMRGVIERGGFIVLSEVTIYTRTLEYVKTLSCCDRVKLFSHQRSSFESWEVELFTGSTSGFFADLSEAVHQDKKVILAASSQSQAEKLERMIKRRYPNKQVVRIDSKTNDKGEFDGFWSDPNDWLRTNGIPDLLIYSPSGRSGVSITEPGFDEAWGHFTAHHPDMWMQMIGRYRLPVPRKIFLVPYVQAYSGDEALCSVRGIRRRLESSQKLSAKMHDIDRAAKLIDYQEAGEDVPRMLIIEQATMDFLAAERAAIGAQKAIAKDYFVHLMTTQGHNITESQCPKDEEVQEELQAIQEELWREKAEIGAALQEGDEKTNIPTWHKELLAFKLRARQEFPGINFDDSEDFYQALVKDYGRSRRGVLLQSAAENYAAAHSLERVQVQDILTRRIVLPHSLPRGAIKAKLIELCGVLALLDGDSYCNDDPRAIVIKTAALKWKREIYYWLRLNVDESQSAVEICNKLLGKLGLDAKAIARPGGKGKRDRIYQVPGIVDPFRNRLLDAARRRLVDAAAESPPDYDVESVNDALAMLREAGDDPDTLRAIWESVQALPECDRKEIWARLTEDEQQAILGLEEAIAS